MEDAWALEGGLRGYGPRPSRGGENAEGEFEKRKNAGRRIRLRIDKKTPTLSCSRSGRPPQLPPRRRSRRGRKGARLRLSVWRASCEERTERERERKKERDKVSQNGEAERRGQRLGSRGTSRHPTVGSETTVSLALSA
ncbi:Hypothetical predicted protein [Xyrichtys novacula]|uniref:Uncharacterized protein n=1 Tax=Xyrichtys novacula TaxID=13765 RepID=A0AAV1HBU4_XYRNO|nr:Hypothetical predicted protein [Xyrichtys novacula]